jgi:putative endonuclease
MHRQLIGSSGERLAAAVLASHGLTPLDRNVELGTGEVDIVALDGAHRVVVEVRTITGNHDPLRAFDPGKAARVGRLAARLGADRVDLVAIRLDREGAELRWVRGAA